MSTVRIRELKQNAEVALPAVNRKIWEMGPLIPAATEGEPTLSDALVEIRRDEKW